VNREAWLTECMRHLCHNFAMLGRSVPERVRVSCSWPSKGALATKKRRIGEAWSSKCSADDTFEIFISPALRDPIEVAATLVHELVHCVVGLECKHRGAFRALALDIGPEGKMTATNAGEELTERLQQIASALGPYPHAELTGSNAPKKQGTRMLKVECQDCGCIVRMTRKWLEDVGPPTCACGGEMACADAK